MVLGAVLVFLDRRAQAPHRLLLEHAPLQHERPAEVMLRVRAVGALLEHLLELDNRVVRLPDGDERRPDAKEQVGIVRMLLERRAELGQSLVHLPRLLEEQPALEREVRVVLVGLKDEVERLGRLVPSVRSAERLTEVEARRDVLRVFLERELVPGDRLVVQSLLFGNVAERPLERGGVRELLQRVLELRLRFVGAPLPAEEGRVRCVRIHRVGILGSARSIAARKSFSASFLLPSVASDSASHCIASDDFGKRFTASASSVFASARRSSLMSVFA